MLKNFQGLSALRAWFIAEKRPLPWREVNSPYAVWISEVMLQQTQVSVVIPYFLRWMKLFPCVESLARAPLEIVIKQWEGLGYYSRVRNLHKGACVLKEKWGGVIPSSPEELSQIPGLGPYTIGAIRAFAFHQKTAAVDGNVMRVLSRYYALEDPIDTSATQKKMRVLADECLPNHEPWVIAEALIELGALICKKQPQCSICPLRSSCQAYSKGLTEKLPIKKPRISITNLHRVVPILTEGQNYLIRRVPEGQVMGGLHEFPYFEVDDHRMEIAQVECLLREIFATKGTLIDTLPQIRHGFTRFDVRLYPYLFQVPYFSAPLGCFWASSAEIGTLSFSSGHRRILAALRLAS